jgi:hydroxyacylglutathione hydrolase
VSRPDESACLVIDPGAEPSLILSVIEERKLEPIAVLVTHGHIDHVGALAAVARSTGAPVYSSRREAPWLRELAGGAHPGYDDAEPYEPDHLLDGGETLAIGPYEIGVRFVPGHSPGSLAFAVDGALYAGDVLFRGSVGRTDLVEGDWPTLQASIASLLAAYPPETPVLSGHGEPTTLGDEHATNPFLEGLRR